MHVLVTCKYKRIRSKATEKRWRHHFLHYRSMGAFCCHGHQSFDPICLKTLCSLSPPPEMLLKFDQYWATGLREIQVWKCKIFVIQGQVTPKWVVWSGPKSNASKREGGREGERENHPSLKYLSIPTYLGLLKVFRSNKTSYLDSRPALLAFLFSKHYLIFSYWL